MSFKWDDFLSIAELLIKDAPKSHVPEAIYRVVISRAYYAAFCTTRNYLHDKGELIPSEKAESHAEIINWLKNSNTLERKQIVNLLRHLRDDRNSADYDDELYGIPVELAAKAIKSSKKIISWTASE